MIKWIDKDFSNEDVQMVNKYILNFNSVNHEVDINKNDIEIPPHSNQIGYWRKKISIVIMQEKINYVCRW